MGRSNPGGTFGLGPGRETGGRGMSSFFSKKERSKENLLGLFSFTLAFSMG